MQIYILIFVLLLCFAQIVYSQRQSAPGLKEAQRKLGELAKAKAARTATSAPPKTAPRSKSAAGNGNKKGKVSFNPVRK